jgi:hypothetical protein
LVRTVDSKRDDAAADDDDDGEEPRRADDTPPLLLLLPEGRQTCRPAAAADRSSNIRVVAPPLLYMV